MGIRSRINSGLKTVAKGAGVLVVTGAIGHTIGEVKFGVGCHDAVHAWNNIGDPNTRVNQVLDDNSTPDLNAPEPTPVVVEPNVPELAPTLAEPVPVPESPPVNNQPDIAPTIEPVAPGIRIIERQPVHFGIPENNDIPLEGSNAPTLAEPVIQRTVVRVSQERLENCGEEPNRIRGQRRQEYLDCLDRNLAIIQQAQGSENEEADNVLPPSTL